MWITKDLWIVEYKGFFQTVRKEFDTYIEAVQFARSSSITAKMVIYKVF